MSIRQNVNQDLQWSSSGSFLLHRSRTQLGLYSVDTSEREPLPQLIYRHDFSADGLDRAFVERQMQHNCPQYRPDFDGSGIWNVLDSVSIAVRPATGEPVIAVNRMYCVPIRKRLDKEMPILRREYNFCYLNHIQLINPLSSDLDVHLTNVANELIERAHSAGNKNCQNGEPLIFTRNIIKINISPDCRRVFYLESPAISTFAYLLLDLHKETVVESKINVRINGGMHVMWAQDSKLIGLSSDTSTDSETRFIDCEAEFTYEECRVVNGSLLALRWVSTNTYNAFVRKPNEPLLKVYKVTIESAGAKNIFVISPICTVQVHVAGIFPFPEGIFGYEFIPRQIDVMSACFDRCFDRCFLVLRVSNPLDHYAVAMSFNRLELHSKTLSDYHKASVATSADASTATAGTCIELKANSIPLSSEICSGSLNPDCPLLACCDNTVHKAVAHTLRDIVNIPRLHFLHTIATHHSASDRMCHRSDHSAPPESDPASVLLTAGGGTTKVASLAELAWRTLYSARGARSLEYAIREKRVPAPLLETILKWNPYTLGPHTSE